MYSAKLINLFKKCYKAGKKGLRKNQEKRHSSATKGNEIKQQNRVCNKNVLN